MKIAVTGTAGRIGRAIHFNLCRDHQVVGIDRALSSATSHVGDINNFEFLVAALEGADAVIHTAALHAPHVGIVDDDEFVDTNIKGTQNVVHAMRALGIVNLVFTSTTALYGHASNVPGAAAWLDEASHPLPESIYHRTKLEAEAYLESEACSDLKVTALRMSRCFPEPAHLMAVYRLHRGVDARDVAAGHRLALNQSGPGYRMYILSGTTPFERSASRLLKADAASVLREVCPSLCRLFSERNWALPSSIDRVYDSAKAQSELGWVPKYGFEDVPNLLDAGISEVLPAEAAGTGISE